MSDQTGTVSDSTPEIVTCEQCLYWEAPERDAPHGHCHRCSPVSLPGSGSSSYHGWPRSKSQDWCGEGKFRATETSKMILDQFFERAQTKSTEAELEKAANISINDFISELKKACPEASGGQINHYCWEARSPQGSIHLTIESGKLFMRDWQGLGKKVQVPLAFNTEARKWENKVSKLTASAVIAKTFVEVVSEAKQHPVALPR